MVRLSKLKNFTLDYFSRSLLVVIGLVLIWRGIWYILDKIDKLFFGGSHVITTIIGIIIGIAILYLPDQDLKELRKL